MTRNLLTFILCTLFFTANAQFTYKQIIQGKAEILFSKKPAHQYIEKKRKFMQEIYKVSDGKVEYIVNAKTFSNKHKLHIKENEISDLYADYVKETIKELDAKLIDQKVIDIKGLKWLEMNFTYEVNRVPQHVYRKVVQFNRTFIAIDFVTLNSTLLKDADARNTFMEGFEITDEVASVIQSTR